MRLITLSIVVVALMGGPALGADAVGANAKKNDAKPASAAAKPTEVAPKNDVKKPDADKPKSEPAKPGPDAEKKAGAEPAKKAAPAATPTKEEAKPEAKPRRSRLHELLISAHSKDGNAKKDEKPSTAETAKKTDSQPAATTKPEAKTGSAVAKKADTPAKKEKKKVNVVVFRLRGEYTEGPQSAGLFSELLPTLASIIQRMDSAAEDKSVGAVLLRIEDLEVGLGKIYELRGAIERIRKAGKKVYAELATADTRRYMLALACDEVMMPPSGTLMIPGVRAELTFYKGLLDKLGIEFDVLKQGRFKAAAEPLVRDKMSPEYRQNLESVVDDAYERLANVIASSRKFENHKAKTLIDQAVFTAASAKQAGLIDRIAYADEVESAIKRQFADADVSLLTEYRKKKIDNDFSGLTGMVKLMELMLGGKSSQSDAGGGAGKKIALIYAIGEITDSSEESGGMFGDEAVRASTMVKAIKKAADDPRVVAIVLRVDSPGGSATASDLIWREVVRVKKPVIASMGDVAASGGYYISMGAKKILAEPGTITGSIGVIGGKPVVSGLYKKLGLTTDVIARGRNSGSLSMNQPFSAEERAAMTTMMEDIYRQFVSKAAQGRKMPFQKVADMAEGRIYSGAMAVRNGLVDGLGTLHDAVIEAKRAAGLKADDKVDLIVLPQPRSFFEQLFGDASVAGEIDARLPGVRSALRRVKPLAGLFKEPALLLMPCWIELK